MYNTDNRIMEIYIIRSFLFQSISHGCYLQCFLHIHWIMSIDIHIFISYVF